MRKSRDLILKEKIDQLLALGHTHAEIRKQLSLNTLKYYKILNRKYKLEPPKRKKEPHTNIKAKPRSFQKHEEYYELKKRVKDFQERSKKIKSFTYKDVMNKFGENPVCYLTGLKIDYNNPKTFSLDHYIPVSKGGDSSINNLKLCHPMANKMKLNHSHEEFINFCCLIADYHKSNLKVIDFPV